ncbi:ligand-gated channel protein [[Haemophilus] felis]|uniref:Ligand-gated channel protein n=1 Tax=[Haemophilus] felis TaxID=123822 RepID=A0A1T0B6D2_9PAST|nr:ligand-gated channel protein [[Haemophilus] felis]
MDEINVQSEQGELSIKERKVGETIKSATQLKRQQVQDSRDLVRYETGITVVEKGRFGASGYAVRGVEENRVAITIDGLQQAETLSSQGFKEIFEGYGNFNNTRNGVEIETLKQAAINKGANSVKVGSGALGGAVMFETKDPRDLLTEKDWHLSYKKGYNSADDQYLDTVTLAGRYKWFDAMVVHTGRKGRETKNFGYSSYDDLAQGRTREKADPYQRKQESTLVKLGFQPNENHRFTAMADLYETRSRGHDFSYTLKYNTYPYEEKELRHTDDSNKRKNYAFSYENFSSNPFYDTLKITYSDQHIRARARTDDYCDGNEKCHNLSNPFGIKYNAKNQLVGQDSSSAIYTKKEGELFRAYFKLYEVDPSNRKIIPSFAKNRAIGYMLSVPAKKKLIFSKENLAKLNDYARKNGFNEVTDPDELKCVTSKDELDSNGKVIPNSTPTKIAANVCEVSLSGKRDGKKEFAVNGETYDMSITEHNNKISIDRARGETLFKCGVEGGINCDVTTKTVEGLNWKTGDKVNIPFDVVEINGEKFAKIKGTQDQSVIVPQGIGYNGNLWTQRDLITRTKQANLDLTKYLQLGKTEHNLAYGALWSETKKEMINHTGESALDVKWWALHKDCGSPVCTKTDTFSYLIPIKATANALYLSDDFKVNDYLSFGLGYRYDRIKYKPEYKPGVSPKIPDDMVTNLFVAEPAFNPKDLTTEANRRLREENANANIAYFSKPKKYSAHSYNLSATVDPLDWLRLQAKYSKGFRAPTGEEIYFTFKHPDFSIRPNPDLKAETAKTKEVALSVHNEYGFLTLSGFETKYDNFIDLMYLGSQRLQGRSALTRFETYQNVNRADAKVRGIEIDSKLNLGILSKKLDEFALNYKFTRQKGRVQIVEVDIAAPTGVNSAASGENLKVEDFEYKEIGSLNAEVPMNAIQPQTHVVGLSYNHRSGKFGVDLFVTHVSEKKAKDTYNMFWRVQKAEETAKGVADEDRIVRDSSIRWRSNAYTLVDVIAYVKPIKNLTLQFGAYNLTNQKYRSWDLARSIRPFGTSNIINQRTGAGINRFNAPGRNFKLSAELTF